MKAWQKWFDSRLPLRSWWLKHAKDYSVPANLNWLYYFGIFSLILLCNQILSGIILTQFYTPTVEQAFNSIQKIMREVPWGWLFRYLHTTGASFLFLVLYMHLFRGLLYGSYRQPRELVWIVGVLLFFCFFLEAFLGYLLPWGQMSYWGAEVISHVIEAFPVFGRSWALLLRGGSFISGATLSRFFAWHIILVPLMILGLTGLHLLTLRKVGSNNPLGFDKGIEKIPFHPFYTSKDLFACAAFLCVFVGMVFYYPQGGGLFLEPNNYLPANVLQTPEDITPVWYMMPFYAILRLIPTQVLGLFFVFFAFFIFLFLPFLDQSPFKAMRFKGRLSRFFFIMGILGFLCLGILAYYPLSPMRILVSRIALLAYFFYFLSLPFLSRFEKKRLYRAP